MRAIWRAFLARQRAAWSERHPQSAGAVARFMGWLLFWFLVVHLLVWGWQ